MCHQFHLNLNSVWTLSRLIVMSPVQGLEVWDMRIRSGMALRLPLTLRSKTVTPLRTIVGQAKLLVRGVWVQRVVFAHRGRGRSQAGVGGYLCMHLFICIASHIVSGVTRARPSVLGFFCHPATSCIPSRYRRLGPTIDSDILHRALNLSPLEVELALASELWFPEFILDAKSILKYFGQGLKQHVVRKP